MTHVYFVRHAQSDKSWSDDRTRPLTELGWSDRKKVSEVLAKVQIDHFYSSPYKRSVDTISDCAGFLNMEIRTDERFSSSGLFELIEKINYTSEIQNNADQYLKAMKSVPAFASVMDGLDEKLIDEIDKEIIDLINSYGGHIGTLFNYSLYIARPV